MMKRILLGLMAMALICGATMAWGEELTLEQLYPAKYLQSMEIKEEEAYHQATGKFCDFDGEDRGNFTYFSPTVKDLQVAEGVMSFRADAPKVLLGWGNYRDAQPKAERVDLWQSGTLEMRVRQSAPEESTWSWEFFHGARKLSRQPKTQKLKGTEWKTLTFWYSVRDAQPDAFTLTITGPANNRIEIDSLRVFQFIHRGHFRKEFTLPPGKVWRAIVNAGPVDIWVNGEPVPFKKPWLFATNPADLTPFLKPEKNVIALYGERIGAERGRGYDPFVYLQGKIIMVSGETVSLNTDETWKGGEEPVPGWTGLGFDDSAWKSPPMRDPYFNYLGGTLPAYEGRVVVENPQGKRLFYGDDQPMVIRVRVPEGLASQKPVIGWVLNSVNEKGEQEIARGKDANFRKVKDSLLYDVNLGQRERGAYSFAATLEIGGKVVEEHQGEPVVVTGRIPMKEVAGDTYEEGMKLVLEDTIDFTDPKDPHVWVESDFGPRDEPAPAITTPRIIRNGDLVYRETVANRGAMFSYQFRFQQPKQLYLIVLEYPDDAQRGIAASVSCAANNIFTGSRGSPGVLTGSKFPLTGKMQELRWICAGNPGINTLDVVSSMNGKSAAAARVRIYRIEELPALRVNPSGERWLGVHTERGKVYITTFGGHERDLGSHDLMRPEGLSERQWFVRQFVEWLGASERYVQYLRFTGQNLHVLGVFQYNIGNTPYTPPPTADTGRLIRDFRDVLVKLVCCT